MSAPITKAGDWFAARQAGKRLPEHELPDDACPICGNPMRLIESQLFCDRCRATLETM
jgi:predicted amidophosphoribosyltransferase